MRVLQWTMHVLPLSRSNFQGTSRHATSRHVTLLATHSFHYFLGVKLVKENKIEFAERQMQIRC